MRAEAEMMSLLLNFFENLTVWRWRCWARILQGAQSCGILEGRQGGGSRYFSGSGFPRIFLEWFSNQSDNESGVVEMFLNKNRLVYWSDFLKDFSQAVYPCIPDTWVMRGRTLSLRPCWCWLVCMPASVCRPYFTCLSWTARKVNPRGSFKNLHIHTHKNHCGQTLCRTDS